MIHPVLRRYWPPESQIQLLIAGLGGRESADRAWRMWTARNNLDDASWAEIRLLATVARRVRELDPTSPWLRRLEGVRRFVWTNTQLNVKAAHPLLAALHAADVRILLIKGAARLALDPRSSADRLLGDIDVLIHLDDWPKALDLANEKGWRSELWPTLGPHIFPHHHSVMIREANGGTVDLHHFALFMCRNVGDDNGLWERAKPVRFRGLSLLAPSPADEVVVSIAHGLLHALSPIADWVLDIAPLIRSGQVDWGVVEAEASNREIDPNIASGLLLATERLNLPVPHVMLDRMIARVREPFVTDFRSFATCHMPSDPWIVDRVKAAAALRALGASRRLNTQSEMPARAYSAPAWSAATANVIRRMMVRSKLTSALRWLKTKLLGTVNRDGAGCLKYSGDGTSLSLAVPNGYPTDTYLVLTASLNAIAESVSERPVVEITVPGLTLKRWRVPASEQSCSVTVGMPAALIAMRRIENVELRVLGSRVAERSTDITLSWSSLGNPATTYPHIFRLFDAARYRLKQPTAASNDVELLWEYLEAGWLEGRNPSLTFDANEYLRSNVDVARAGVNPLLHFIRHGKAEGRTVGSIPSDADSADCELVEKSNLFDVDFYRAKYPDVLASDLRPIDQFMRGGWRGGRSPGPQFDTEWYLNCNPDVAAADVNPLLHYLRSGKMEGRAPHGPDSRIVSAIRAAAPGLMRVEPELQSLPVLRNPERFVTDRLLDQGLVRAFGGLFQSLNKTYERIIFVPWISHGGADLVAMQVAKIVLEIQGPDSVLIVTTDSDHLSAVDWVPRGADLRTLSTFHSQLSEHDRARFVAGLVQAISPKAVMNINSRACWDAYKRYGKSLVNSSDLYAMLFGCDFDQHGRPIGYADTHFRDCLSYLKRIYSDTERFPHEIAMKFGLTENARSKLLCLRPPPEADVTAWVRPPFEAKRKFSVLWAGRWVREKNIDLLIEICRFATDMEIHVFGRGSDYYTHLLMQAQTQLGNLIVEGEYPSFKSLPINKHDVFLYTSLWDGMPRVLVSAGAGGIPIVASDIGGIGELIDSSTGWPVRDSTNVLSYVNALREVRADPAEADQRRRRLTERIARDHNWQKFQDSLTADPGFIGDRM